MPRTYGKRPCYVCGEQVTTNGMGQTAHMRRHVREGTAVGLALLNRHGVPGRVEYMRLASARRRMANDTQVRWAVVEGTLPEEEAG